MSNLDIETLTQGIQKNWASPLGDKAKAYVGQFSNRIRIGTKIVAKVNGNHGTYTVSIQVSPQLAVVSACSCYIGKGGYCHHCAALAKTFLETPESFVEKIAKNSRRLADKTLGCQQFQIWNWSGNNTVGKRKPQAFILEKWGLG